jgi:hypothetical protein
MSTTKRRQRRAQQQAATQANTAVPAPATEASRPALPQWKWKTFPVYLAFWLGALIFLELGIIAGATGGSTFSTVVSAVVALFLGFGVARLLTTWMRQHNWVKPRPKRS